jgi:hypothetical protein
MMESVIVALPPVVLMPPPADVAWFLTILLEAMIRVPSSGKSQEQPASQLTDPMLPMF